MHNSILTKLMPKQCGWNHCSQTSQAIISSVSGCLQMQKSSSGAYGSTSVTATCVMAPLLSPVAPVRGRTPALAPAPLMTTEPLIAFEAAGLDDWDSAPSFLSPAASRAVLPSTY